MKQYRTSEQFEEIIESMTNGNWSQAGRECVEYGFYANDLLNAFDEAITYDDDLETMRDLVLLSEMAAEARYKK